MPNHEELPEHIKKLVKSKYKSAGFGNYNKNQFNEIFADIDERLSDIEHKVNPTAKKILSTRAQQMLLLHHLGFLDKLGEFGISNKKKAKILSILLNASPDNIGKDLSMIYDPVSRIKTSGNYKVINAAFKQAGIKTLIDDTEIILEKLEKQENK
ncbi:hypothetical protein FW778_12860 [Ginsengibacter hankyongi]|uniref:Uncharacterized protein n=1 Tax=Ginsengibacter hankyongi TaxID=2607284 RepID=A0A5J5IHA3_9BACT|nr:hypothetical protein [Ginsengibacter hankyongi]KAA9038450.1 hypothetical protein FW778_12860 [Ginsengibacter hankyongi]